MSFNSSPCSKQMKKIIKDAGKPIKACTEKPIDTVKAIKLSRIPVRVSDLNTISKETVSLKALNGVSRIPISKTFKPQLQNANQILYF